jgi:hypothetical protein
VADAVGLWWPPAAVEDVEDPQWELVPRSRDRESEEEFERWRFGQPQSVRLSPLQWLLAVAAEAVPTPLHPGHLKHLFQDALCCLLADGHLFDMPHLPRLDDGPPLPACSAFCYLLK